MKHQFVGVHWDFIGFSASMACAIHCAALPFLLSLAPLAGLQFLNNPWVEYSIILLSFFVASYALVHGYYRHHRKWHALIIVAAGFASIGLGHLLAEGWKEVLLTSCGAVVIAVAHLVNWKQLRQCRVEHSHYTNQEKSSK